MTIDDIGELFREVAVGNAHAVAAMVHYRPELSRAVDSHGLSVLEFARYAGRQEILAALIAAGPPLDIFEAASLDDAKTVALHAKNDAQRDARDAAGRTALHHAARTDACAALVVLIDAGAEVNARAEASGETPLHLAVARGSVGAARLLLRAGADPNAQQRNSLTPLMLAAATNARAVAEMLFARNALSELRDAAGETAADIAAARGHLELAARIRVGERMIDRSLL